VASGTCAIATWLKPGNTRDLRYVGGY